MIIHVQIFASEIRSLAYCNRYSIALLRLVVDQQQSIDTDMGIGDPGTQRFTSIERALFYLKRLQSLKAKYDLYYYDFRPPDELLGVDVLPDEVTTCEQIVVRKAHVKIKPNPLHYLV